jgi:Uma2 family endonuclease
MQPVGTLSRIAGFLAVELTWEFRRLKLPYFIPNKGLVKIPSKENGYLPDVLILNARALADEPLWSKYSTV